MKIIEKSFFVLLVGLLLGILYFLPYFIFYPQYEMFGVVIYLLIMWGMYEFIVKLGIIQAFPSVKDFDSSYRKIVHNTYINIKDFIYGSLLIGGSSLIVILFLLVALGLIALTFFFISSLTPVTIIILLLCYIAFFKK